MVEGQMNEKMAILFNRIQGRNLNIIEWDIKPDKGMAIVNDDEGNTFKITIEPQREVTT